MASRTGSRSKNTSSEASLLEQVRLLKIENDTLRSFIAEKGIGETLHPTSANLDSKATETRSRRVSPLAGQLKKSPNVPTTPHASFTNGKGCLCKGNCSTKKCGCIKRNIPCMEFCRCGDELCQNSEPDKENIGDSNQAQLSKDGEESLIELSKLTLGDEKGPKKKLSELLPQNKRLEKVIEPRSIFSPGAAENVFTFEDANVEEELAGSSEENDKGKESQEEPAKNSKKKDYKKSGNSKAKFIGAAARQTEPVHPALTDHAIIDDHSASKPSKKWKNNVEKRGKATEKPSTRVDLNTTGEPAQNHKHSEPEPTTKRKKKEEIRETTNAPTARQRNRIDSDIEDVQKNKHSDPGLTNKKNKKANTKINGAEKKDDNRISSKETDEEDPQKIKHPEPKPVNKIKKKEETKSTSTIKKRNNIINSEEMDEEDSEGNEENEENERSVAKTWKPTNKNKIKVENKGIAVSKKRKNQISDDEASEESANSESESEAPYQNLKASKKALNTRGTGKRNNERVDSQNKEVEEDVVARENEHSDSDSESKQRRNQRIHFQHIDEVVQDTENSKHEPEPLHKKKKLVAKKAMASGDGNNQNNRVDSEDDAEMTLSQNNENFDSDHEPGNSNKKKDESNGRTMPSKSKRNNRIHSEDTDDASEKIENTESEPEPENDDNSDNDAKKETPTTPAESNASSRLSYGTDTLIIPETDDFNPMKPRRQLSRSPLAPRIAQRPQRIDVSNVPLPIPVKEEPEEVSPPAELAKDIVEDWDEHQAMLVKCRKCGRTFHPHRIKKHETSCIKI